MAESFLLSALIIAGNMLFFFIFGSLRRDNSFVDVGWPLGFMLVALATFAVVPAPGGRRLLLCLLVLAWGARLAGFILWRKRGGGEDFRYAAMREKWGRRVLLNGFFKIYLLQGFLLFFVAFPIVIGNSDRLPAALNLLDLGGVFLFTCGFLLETAADWQMQRFRKRPGNRGRLLMSGVWRFSRHPNYFGETLVWWGIFLIALNAASGWMAAISPLLITFLLRFVSGVPLLEKKFAGRADFAVYKKRTSLFVPWFPKRG